MKKRDTALITGASGGIGLELARIHASKGGNLVLVARTIDKLENLKSELVNKHHVDVTVIQQDLANPNSAQQVFEKTNELGVVVDILINNAGFGGHGRFHERELAADQSMMQVNMVTLTNLTHLYLPGMLERNHGRILNVSSTASFMPGPLQAVYYATKAYVTSLTQAIAEEISDSKVTATALCPGFVNTGFAEASNLEGVDALKNAKSAESVARCGYAAMLKGDLVAFNEGGLKFMLNWIVPLLPRKAVLRMSRGIMEKRPA